MDADGPMWTLRDAAIEEFLPTFPELAVHVMITDGCGCQVLISCVSSLLMLYSIVLIVRCDPIRSSKGAGHMEGLFWVRLDQRK